MRILVSAAGSHGDMLPFIAIASRLRERGHDARFFGSGSFEHLATRARVPFVATTPPRPKPVARDDIAAGGSRAGLAQLGADLMKTVPASASLIAQAIEPDNTLVLASTFGFAARLVAETHRLPLAVVQLSPSWFRSVHLPPRMTPLGHFAGLPAVFKRAFWRMLDARLLDPAFAVPFNRIRATHGLAPVERMSEHWIHRGAVTIGLFPPWFAPRQPDWPRALECVGFPAQRGSEPLSDMLAEFLSSGAPPIVFTAGTAGPLADSFVEQASDACERIGRRGVIVGQSVATDARPLAEHMIAVNWAPFDQLLPRAAAIAHHGGIGTTAAALAAGIPQLIRPLAFDQFDNSSRARKLGVARELPARRWKAREIAQGFEHLLNCRATQAACADIRQRMLDEDGIGAACDLIEHTRQ